MAACAAPQAHPTPGRAVVGWPHELDGLERRADAGRVTATLIEYDARIAERARAHARRVAADVRVRHADAGVTSSYADAVPADLVLLCGIFGNISDADVRRTVASAPALCRPGATVIWTRHRKEPDLTPAIRAWFDAERFEEVDFVAPDHAVWSVGVARFTGEPRVLSPDERLFTFVR